MGEIQTYAVSVRCINCYHQWVEEIVKGTPVPSRLKCPRCGCKEGRSYIPNNPSL